MDRERNKPKVAVHPGWAHTAWKLNIHSKESPIGLQEKERHVDEGSWGFLFVSCHCALFLYLGVRSFAKCIELGKLREARLLKTQGKGMLSSKVWAAEILK